ncbi:MAG: hypothetical protein ACOZF0_02020 [Thermodesulfobacteriota bacterium]
MKTAAIALLTLLCLTACSKRLAELQQKYPKQNGRYTILDEKTVTELEASEIEGLYMREIELLMGFPAEKKSYYERKHHERFFVPGTSQVRSDDWIYPTNEGNRMILIKFEDKAVTRYTVMEK